MAATATSYRARPPGTGRRRVPHRREELVTTATSVGAAGPAAGCVLGRFALGHLE